MRYGLTIPYPDQPLAAQAGLLREAAAAGYTDFWTGEASGADAFTPLALAAAWVPDVMLGTAIVPAFTRGPAVTAMSAAALAEAAPGRFVLGIGASSPAVVEQWNGIPFEHPFQRVRDVLRFLRDALAGQKITHDYASFRISGFRLDRPPQNPPPVYVAALRPGMLRLAGTEGDGAIVNWLSADDVRTVVPHVGAAPVVARIFVCPSDDVQAIRALGRRMIAAYLNVPAYAAFQEWLGRGPALEGMWKAWQAGDRKAALAAIPDQVVDDLIVHGPPERCREMIGRYVSNGVTVPVLAPVPVGMSYHDAALKLAPLTGTHPSCSFLTNVRLAGAEEGLVAARRGRRRCGRWGHRVLTRITR
jgi:probable F420-dependent oxidoreductase